MKVCKTANSNAMQGGFPDRAAVSPGSAQVWSSMGLAGRGEAGAIPVWKHRGSSLWTCHRHLLGLDHCRPVSHVWTPWFPGAVADFSY